jgi:hypothetical protein
MSRGLGERHVTVSLSLPQSLALKLNALPSGERSARVTDILLTNGSLLGMSARETQEIRSRYIDAEVSRTLIDTAVRLTQELSVSSIRQLKLRLSANQPVNQPGGDPHG